MRRAAGRDDDERQIALPFKTSSDHGCTDSPFHFVKMAAERYVASILYHAACSL